MHTTNEGRPNQRLRTRKDLLEAAARLVRRGRNPTLDEIAKEALVSRATAYRYFPTAEALLAEAALHIVVPEPDAMFQGAHGTDPVARLERVDAVLHDAVASNEPAMRMMIAHSMQGAASRASDGKAPARQNRRLPLIEAALEPSRAQFRPQAYKNLCRALAVVMGTESFVVFRDVLQMNDASARKVRQWTIRALVDAAKHEPE